MNRRKFLKNLAKAGTACPLLISSCNSVNKTQPNVLFIIVDDMGTTFSSMIRDRNVKTPNMRRLAARGTAFSNAYCSAPACGPSRASFMTGIRPSTSGVYTNDQPYRKADTWVANVDNLADHFKQHGYLVAGYGKVFHMAFQIHDKDSFTPGHFTPFEVKADMQLKEFADDVVDVPDTHPYYSWGKLPDSWDRDDENKMQQDTQNTNRAIRLLQSQHDQPFLCCLGLWKPHLCWYVPQRYFDMYPLSEIQIPEGFKTDDLEDLPECARWFATHRGFHHQITRHNLWKKAMQAYMAAVTYADEQIGRVLDALESSPYNDNTIVVLAGDNGWHTGEKEHWSKYVLWERGTEVPFAISIPDVNRNKNTVSNTPVSLLDIYPTLVSLCGLPQPKTHKLEGIDLTPVLHDPKSERDRPVISTFDVNNHSVRTKRYRYIRYRNGAEELYDHNSDGHEWNNLAGDPAYASIKRQLRKYLPEINAPRIRHLYEGRSKRVTDDAFK